MVNYFSLRSSRAGFYFFAAAKRSKQEMPSHTQIPKNHIVCFSKIRKLAALKQFGFFNEKQYDFLYGIWLMRSRYRNFLTMLKTLIILASHKN
jgi:hypothetical protein